MFPIKQKEIAWIWSHHLHLQWKFKLWAGKFTWGDKAKHCWVLSTNFLFSKVLLITPGNVLPLHLKQTFPPIIWNFTEGEGGGMESRLSFEIFFTLLGTNLWLRQSPTTAYFDLTTFSQEVSSSNHVKKSSLDLEHKLLRYSKIYFRTRVEN